MDVRMANQEAPRTVEDVFSDFASRRIALVKALTTDAETFYHQCDPEKDNLCLYGLPNEVWDLNLPVEEVPPELPEPALGINFARDGMPRKDWFSLVAVHSDSWLLAVAFYFGARFGFDKTERKRLFDMINELPSLFEVLNRNVVKQRREQPASTQNSINRNRSIEKPRQSESVSMTKGVKMSAPPNRVVAGDDDEDNESGEENEDDDQGATCGACGDNDGPDDFWICCDLCEVWFHGKCVNITPAKAERIAQYKCPRCNFKKARVFSD